MPYCADTNILLRWIEPGTPMCDLARDAVKALRLSGETVYITPQNLVEFWNGATRPAHANGLDLTPAQADAEASKIEALFPLLPDTPAVHTEWRRMVVTYAVSGVQVHDTRIVAALQTYGITHLLTFNTQHFKRFGTITAVHPSELIGGSGTVIPGNFLLLSHRQTRRLCFLCTDCRPSLSHFNCRRA